ncbi:uncharacterized protein LOC117181133 [Belonocnema kinseyi]|uniref:uncharacterized protein LOC117181133 n=1 Tax=Belonocnema kinseyi TaxID=2817044 RepID=UPI00143CF56B|nr:uncharacterized protein LOC117181133 [Belonocnema kinseyi]
MAATREEENHKPNNSIDDLGHLEQALHAAAAYMSSQAKHEDAVIFIGSTRSGKSSLINYIIGNQLIGEKFSVCKPVVLKKADNNSPGPQIGIGSTSETIIPSRWDSEKLHNLGIWDAPGFDDTRGTFQDIRNAFYINELFKNIKSAKIILVTDINDIANDSIRPFLSLLNSVENIFKEKMKECYSGIGIIFSKVPNTLYENVVDKNFINELLKEQVLSSKAIEISEPAKEFIRYLIKNNQNIGLFRRATAGHISDDIIDAGIFETIKETNGVHEQILKQVSPSITHSSTVFLFNVREKLTCMQVFIELEKLVGNIFEQTLIDFETMKYEGLSHDKLIQWTQELSITSDRISKVLNSDISFHEKMSELKVIDPRIEHLIKIYNLLQKAKIMEFIDQLLNLKESRHFDINLQSILLTAKTKVDELLIWVKLQLKEITIKEAEAQASEAREEYEKEIKELKTQMEGLTQHNEKVKKELGLFAYVGSAIDSGLEKISSTLENSVETIVARIKRIWNIQF